MTLDAPDNFINREISWLDFNLRVLAEAENPEVPLLERLKFLAIVSSNLDEFFMVRVALMHRDRKSSAAPAGPDGLSAREALLRISEKAHAMVERQYACLTGDLVPALARAGIHLVRPDALTGNDREFLGQLFREQVLPILTPMAIDTGHPFPLLASGALYILFRVEPLAGAAAQLVGRTDTVLVQVPSVIERFISLPGSERGQFRVALLGDVITIFAEELLGGYRIQSACRFRVTRDADINVDDDQADDLLTAIESELRSRRWGAPIRLEVGTEVPPEIVQYLQRELKLAPADIYRIPAMLNLRSLFHLVALVDRPDLLDPVWPPQPHPLLLDDEDIFSIIRRQDIILHHPYQKFQPVMDFLAHAADDPQVLAIKITLYRVSGDSPVVTALVRAAENGKQVTALVELRARFDEETNITWARRLDAAGAHVIYGVVGYKTHSKVALVVRREADGICRYVHLATGNYNDKTARLYTDLGLLTARPEFGADISAFFNVITGYSLPPKWNRIAIAPLGLRERFIALIDREIEKHTPETPGFIRAKMNSLIDASVIQAVYRASQAGVRVDLVVRGTCRLRAGVRGLSENVRVRSILDRFLEHSRIYHVHNGGNEEVYLASADWMERNFDRRLELLFPVLDPDNRREVLAALAAALEDNTKAWDLRPDNTYARVERKARAPLRRCQEHLYETACEAIVLEARARRKQLLQAKSSPDR